MMGVRILQTRCIVIQPRTSRMLPVRFSAHRGIQPTRRNFSLVTLKNAPIETHIAEEDLVHLQRMSLRIMEDPICEFPKERLEQYVNRQKNTLPAYNRTGVVLSRDSDPSGDEPAGDTPRSDRQQGTAAGLCDNRIFQSSDILHDDPLMAFSSTPHTRGQGCSKT